MFILNELGRFFSTIKRLKNQRSLLKSRKKRFKTHVPETTRNLFSRRSRIYRYGWARMPAMRSSPDFYKITSGCRTEAPRTVLLKLSNNLLLMSIRLDCEWSYSFPTSLARTGNKIMQIGEENEEGCSLQLYLAKIPIVLYLYIISWKS